MQILSPAGGQVRGTGVVVGRGLILTAWHVLLGLEDPLALRTADGPVVRGRVRRRAGLLDLALIQAPEVGAPDPTPTADRSDIHRNDTVFLVGAPFGLGDSFVRGYVAHVERRGIDPSVPDVPFIQTMGLIYPGCSGAGVYLADGRFIGISKGAYGLAPDSGIGLVIPAETVSAFLREAGVRIGEP